MKESTAALLYSATVFAFISVVQPANAQMAPPDNLKDQINQVQQNLQNYIGVIGHDAVGLGSDAASVCIALMESDAASQGVQCPAGTGVNVQVLTMTCNSVPLTFASVCDCSGTVNLKNPCQAAY